MIEVLQFTFQSFWHFAGVYILFGMAIMPIMAVIEFLGSKK